ncbi:hypothetical protein [Vandammella animalimorsus]|nr:hypothetical protein [Vandammella animalimorsus]
MAKRSTRRIAAEKIMIFAAVFEKWEKSLLIAADNAGLDSLIELLKKQ